MTEFFNPEAFSPSGKANKKFVSAVVVAPNGEVLCQLRDDIPGIIHPGCWTSSPGGTVEQGESTLDAVSHEMLEEFNVQIVDVEPLTSFELEGEFAGEYYIFSTKLASPLEDVCCNEGQKAAFFKPSEALKLNQPALAENILLKYMDKLDI